MRRNQQNEKRRFISLIFAITVAILSLVLLSSSPASAYLTFGGKWKDSAVAYYSIDSNLDSNLGVTGATNIIENQAAARWNTSRLLLVRDQTSSNYIKAVDFRYVLDPVCGGLPYSDPAATCVEPSSSDSSKIVHTRTYLDTSGLWVWNSSGTMYCLNSPGSVDVLNVVLHEFGHVYGLDHPSNHTEAVMWPDCTIKYDLREDDKSGVTQIYGPRTGWESGFATGELNTIAYGLNISGYSGGTPELGPRSSEFSVIPISGSSMELLAGQATSTYSYAYMRLFTSANDSGTHRVYLTIKSGMRLKWYQYNYQQRTMSVDFRMTDGSTLRDSGLSTGGLPVHPAQRYNAPARIWFANDVDLTPLQGKTIDQWMIAYDNSATQWQYVYRAYFDNVRIEY